MYLNVFSKLLIYLVCSYLFRERGGGRGAEREKKSEGEGEGNSELVKLSSINSFNNLFYSYFSVG